MPLLKSSERKAMNMNMMPRIGPLSVAVLFLGACGDEASLPFDSLSGTREASVETCPQGGVLLVQGLDDNRDGVLQDGEIDSQEPVCVGDPGDQGPTGPDGLQVLVRVDAEVGDNCPMEGDRIRAGVDDDGSGTLDPGEVDATTFLCAGVDGVDAPALLTVTTTVGVQGDCGAVGGTRLDSGLDLDADGILEATEIDASRLVCNGEDARTTLVTVEDLPPGDPCSAGGRRIQTGVDEDSDQVLSAAEVQDEVFLCSPAVVRVEVTELQPGDAPECPLGGRRIDSGLDLNGDQVLEASEVFDTAFTCAAEDGVQVLAAITPADPADCPDGGSRIAIGLDADGSGALDGAEQTQVRFVCNGAPGLDATSGGAVRIDDEPAGSNCPQGGSRIETGIDANANGVLDDAEVAATRFACAGVAANALVQSSVELPGPNCADGGRRVQSGRDLNGDGALQVEEVEETVFVCSTVASVPMRIETTSLIDGLRDAPYGAQITAVGGVGGAYSWAVTSGSLPPGLALDPTGTPATNLSGTPSAGGTFLFTVEVSDGFGNSDTQDFSVLVEAPFDITQLTLPRLEAGTPYSASLTADGGSAPLTWSVVSGALPAGITLASDGSLSGTPTGSQGSYAVFEVRDATGEFRRVGISVKGEQNFIAYCGDVNTDTEDELVVGQLGSTGSVTATRTVNFPNADADCFDQIEFSPAGNAIAFTGEETSGIEELYVADLSSFPAVTTYRVNPAFTSTDQDITDFAWAPTGEFIGYRADDDVNFREELFVADLRNLVSITVTQVNEPISGTSSALEVENFQWIPLSNKLVYQSDEVTSSERNIYFWDATTAATRIQINGLLPSFADVNTNYVLSLDGEWLAYTSDELVNDQVRVFVVDVSGSTPGAPQDVSGAFDVNGDVAQFTGDMAISPNGRFLAFIGDADNLGQEVYIRDLTDLASPRVRLSPELTSTLLVAQELAWGPSGRRLAARGDFNVNGETELYILNVELPGTAAAASGVVGSADVELFSDTFAWSPQGDYVVFEFDGVTSGQDEPYLTFIDDLSNPIRIFPMGINDDVNRTKISEDGRFVYTAVDFDGASTLELFVTEVAGPVVSTPVALHPSPLGSSQDVLEDFFLVDGGNQVLYVSDEDVVDTNEAYLRQVTAGPTVSGGGRVNGPLPTGGNVISLAVEVE